MSNMIYPILLAIFVFASVTTYINDSGLYSGYGVVIPTEGMSPVTTQLEQVNETNRAMLGASKDSGFSVLEQFWIFGKAFVGGIIALFTLGPLLQSLGVPIGMAGMILSPLGFVFLMFLYEMFFGRSAE